MNTIQNYGINYNVNMKANKVNVLSKIESSNKIVTLDKFVKEVTPLMDESGERLDLNKLSDEDLELITWIKKWIVKKYSEGIETFEGLKKYFSTSICRRPPLLYNESKGMYNGISVTIGTPVNQGDKYVKLCLKDEFEAAEKLGLKSKLIRLPKLDPFYKHYKEVLDGEGRVLKRDTFEWDSDEKVMFWTERHFKPEDYERSMDINRSTLPMNEWWDKELISEYNCEMHYRGKVHPDVVAEARKRGIIPQNEMPEYIK